MNNHADANGSDGTLARLWNELASGLETGLEPGWPGSASDPASDQRLGLRQSLGTTASRVAERAYVRTALLSIAVRLISAVQAKMEVDEVLELAEELERRLGAHRAVEGRGSAVFAPCFGARTGERRHCGRGRKERTG